MGPWARRSTTTDYDIIVCRESVSTSSTVAREPSVDAVFLLFFDPSAQLLFFLAPQRIGPEVIIENCGITFRFILRQAQLKLSPPSPNMTFLQGNENSGKKLFTI
ncbi:unnamed protein product [Amoebophrya sp. A25]|nr:unnamed protein product [Amoebophrya sp. A25]